MTTSVLEAMSDAAAAAEHSGDLQALTREAPRTLRTWATAHAGAFR